MAYIVILVCNFVSLSMKKTQILHNAIIAFMEHYHLILTRCFPSMHS